MSALPTEPTDADERARSASGDAAERGPSASGDVAERVDSASDADEAPTSKLGRRLALGVLLGLVVYAAMVLWGDADALGDALRRFPLGLLPAAMGLSFANYLVRFFRWERYRTLLGVRLDGGTSFLIYLAGLALTVSPGKMGEVLKSWLVRRVTGTPVHETAPIVVAERFTDLLGFLVLVAVGGLGTAPEYAWVFWATLGLSGALLVLAGSERFERALVRLCERLPLVARAAPKISGSMRSARTLLAPRELLLPTLLAAVGWGLECVGFWIVASAFVEGGVPFLFAVFTFALSSVAGAVLILFPGGLGVTEASLGGLLAREYQRLGLAADVARTSAASATILIRLCTLWFAVGVGFLALGLFRRRYGQLETARRVAGA